MPNRIVCGRLLTYSKICPIYKMKEPDSVISEKPSVSMFHNFTFSWAGRHALLVIAQSLPGSRAILVPYVKELKEVQRQAFQDAENSNARMCSKGTR